MEILTASAPSVLTLPALEKNDFPVPPAWRIHLPGEANPAWISPDRSRFLPADSFENPPPAPAYVAAVISKSPTVPDDLLARTRIDFPAPLFLDWILTDPAAITDSVRTQTRWTLGLLSASVLVSGLGLAAIMHSVRRERRLNHLKSQFVASVSHELRAPIGTIRLMADALEKEKITDPKDFHRLIVSESTRLSISSKTSSISPASRKDAGTIIPKKPTSRVSSQPPSICSPRPQKRAATPSPPISLPSPPRSIRPQSGKRLSISSTTPSSSRRPAP